MNDTKFSTRRRIWGGTMRGLMVLCAGLTCALALFLILYVLIKGVPHLSWELLSTKPSYLTTPSASYRISSAPSAWC